MALKTAFLGIDGLTDVGYRVYAGNTPVGARVTEGIEEVTEPVALGLYQAAEAPELEPGQRIWWDSLSEPDAVAWEDYQSAGSVELDPAVEEKIDYVYNRLLVVVPADAPLEPVPVPTNPSLANVRCTADKERVKFTFTPVDNEKDFIGGVYRKIRHYSGYTALTDNGFEVLIDMPKSSVLGASGFSPPTYRVTSDDDFIGTVTVPDGGGILQTLVEESEGEDE